MLKAKGNQPLGKAQRDEALCGRARNLQHPGDLVLRVTGNEIEPPGPRGFVQT
jgi:hypothetical protein